MSSPVESQFTTNSIENITKTDPIYNFKNYMLFINPFINNTHQFFNLYDFFFHYNQFSFITPNYFLLNQTLQTSQLNSFKLKEYLKKKNSYDSYSLTYFLHLKYSHFSKFFIEHNLDTPICFLKSVSNKRKISHLYLFKLANYITVAGKKEKALKSLSLNLNFFFRSNRTTFHPLYFLNFTNSFPHSHAPWYFFFLNLLFFIKIGNSTKTSQFLLNAEDQNQMEFGLTEKQKLEFRDKILFKKYNNNAFFNGMSKQNDPSYFTKNFIYKKLTQLKPIFNFFVYNVDKNIRKFSRGKSGKYVFVWKYIPSYKRNNLVLNLLKKNIIFSTGKNFNQKLLNIFELIFFSFKESFLWKSKIFMYNYIYKNFKKTLMTNFKTIK